MTTATATPPVETAAAAPSSAVAAVPAQSSLSNLLSESKPAAPAAPAAAQAAVAPVVAAVATPDAKPVAVAETKPAAAAIPATDAKPAEITLKAIDGSPLSAEDVQGVAAFAKENGLSQAQAEKVLARESAGRTAMQAQADGIGAKWEAEAKAHPEIGGDKLAATVTDAKRALAALLPAKLREEIVNSPYANNPTLLLLLKNAAALLPKEDVVHSGSAAAGATGPINPAHVIYSKFAPKG